MNNRINPFEQIDSAKSPGLTSLLWDNFKTTAYFGSLVPGIIPIACCAIASEGATPESISVGHKISIALFGLPIGLASTLPFAIGAAVTRQYKTNSLIKAGIDFLMSCVNELDQRYIINQILDNTIFQLGHVQSYESFNLLDTLEKYKDSSIDFAWNALLNYLNERARFNKEAHVHNGKRTFNSILNVAENVKEKLEFRLAVLAGDTNLLDRYSNEDFLRVDWHGRNAFHWCAVNNAFDLMPYLFSKLSHDQLMRAFIRPINLPRNPDHGKTMIHLAIERNCMQVLASVINYCQEHGERTPLYVALGAAARYGKLDVIKKLIADDPNILNMEIDNYRTPLMEAAAHGHLLIVQYLIEQGCDLDRAVNHPGSIDHNKSAVEFAEERGHKEIVKMLLAVGASDALINQLRRELTQLIPIIRNFQWTQEGWGIFTNHTPRNIDTMRSIIRDTRNIEHIDTMDRETLLRLARDLKNSVRNAGYGRSDNTLNLYTLVSKLGHTTQEDFNKLAMFSPAVEQQRAFSVI